MYRRAEELADFVWDVVVRWEWFAKRTVGVQWTTATDSMGSNIAESGGRYHPADARKFLYNARGSLRESKVWSRRALRRELITLEQMQYFERELEQLSREINASIGHQNDRIRERGGAGYLADGGGHSPPHYLTTSPPDGVGEAEAL
jgi:four helix bundle protein